MISTDKKIRRQLGYWTATVMLYVLYTGLLWVETRYDAAPLREVRWLTVIMISAVSLFFILIRLSNRLALQASHPSVAQGIFAITYTIASYALIGPARGSTLSILLVVLVFCSFTISTSISHRLSVFAITLLGLVMFWLVRTDAERFSPRLELIHFLVAASILMIVAFLTGKLSELRAKLKAQKIELGEALARNRILATQDALTALANRRYMSEVFEEEERALS